MIAVRVIARVGVKCREATATALDEYSLAAPKIQFLLALQARGHVLVRLKRRLRQALLSHTLTLTLIHVDAELRAFICAKHLYHQLATGFPHPHLQDEPAHNNHLEATFYPATRAW